MPAPFALKPTHAPVKAYTLALTQLAKGYTQADLDAAHIYVAEDKAD